MNTESEKGTAARASRDLPGPLAMGLNCWMVGHRNAATLLQCNTYLRVLGEGNSAVRVCIDPGSQLDLEVIRANLAGLIGGLKEIDFFTLNHQDPDVVGNSPYFCEANPQVGVVVTEEVWRLVQHLRMKPGRVQFANPARLPRLRLSQHATWQPLPTPFCHFRGAMAYYDPEIRTLFTGDLFGGFNQLGRIHLFAEEDDWAGIAQFHQIYMPTREVLRYAVRQIRALQPRVEVIAPQHGYVIAGRLVELFLDKMYDLEVGNDLLAAELDESYLSGYREVLDQMVSWAAEMMGKDEVFERLKHSNVEDGLGQLIRIDGDSVQLAREAYSAIAKVFARISQGEPPEFTNAMRSLVLDTCSERRVPIPPIGLGIEDSPATGASPAD